MVTLTLVIHTAVLYNKMGVCLKDSFTTRRLKLVCSKFQLQNVERCRLPTKILLICLQMFGVLQSFEICKELLCRAIGKWFNIQWRDCSFYFRSKSSTLILQIPKLYGEPRYAYFLWSSIEISLMWWTFTNCETESIKLITNWKLYLYL